MIGGKRYITIASDASVGMHGKTKGNIGLAYYIRDDEGTFKKAWSMGRLHGMSSTAAELMAMTEALKFVAERGVEPNTTLIYYCDNITALRVLKGENNKRKWFYYTTLMEPIRSLFIEIDTRHVKSHSGKNDLARYFLNRWVDFNARSMMRSGEYHKGGMNERKNHRAR